ncbi:lipid-A-disaccharide synthase-related protein [Candidatus Synechococcus calcipolaris G9]|uniref:Lipid-A-disaccharide synthase-related protein n=1 Tax=Candidatus Synechococcus calcipolaris G9 TaxID=1497997 RepID=A0ABT6EYW8_9SYNE|nr:lipid-A-disaccharide synthase-related protein [Candidatus Synechococcus calcipolaris]MDG2990453.1 lipid-A-disaccharide synthase-related protein [Candidatus Synechococcus calcipolaris G9]
MIPPSPRLLCLSNGHGEDEIATAILVAIQALDPQLPLAALPIVGEGKRYQRHQIRIIGRVQAMPSGGFIYMDRRQLWRDIQGGLVRLTLDQLKTIWRWAKQVGRSPQPALVLAVGDIVPLLFAWLSGINYVFIGTAKSEYYLRTEEGWLDHTPWSERWLGGAYAPWERWLMARPRCLGVFPRDFLTTETLMSRRIRAFDLGNPMMDDLPPPRITRPDLPYTYVVTLLPGSRPPEAYENWQRMIEAATNYSQQPDPSHPPASSLLLAAIAPGLENATLIQEMETQGWQSISWPPELAMMGFAETEQRLWQRGLCFLALTQRAFAACVHLADGAIAMAGTATEQCVGLGKPVVTFAGNGPQFTLNFALNQARLLGCSIERVESPELAFPRLRALLQNPTQLEQIRRNGQKRLGAPGAAKRIGQKILELGFGIQSDHESKDPSANGSKLERDRSGK